jgi:hypothetical protein
VTRRAASKRWTDPGAPLPSVDLTNHLKFPEFIDSPTEEEGFEPSATPPADLDCRGSSRKTPLTIAAKRPSRQTMDRCCQTPSYLDLGAEFDDPVRRDAKKLGGPRRNAYKAGIEALAPPCHPGP